MSDTTVADPGSAPAAAPSHDSASARREVPINQNPTSSPSPLPPQAPPAPTSDIKGSPHRPLSRRESLIKAFEDAKVPVRTERHTPRPEPKPAEARMGHNNPPEPTEPEKINLKKRPLPENVEPKAEPPRGDHGHFVPREQTPPANQQQPRQAQPRQQSHFQPPVRMSELAKRDWHATPETVKGDIHRIQKEFATAYNYYKSDYEAFKPIKHYHELAQSHGTTLDKALENYIGIERKLYADPIAGLDVIVNNLAKNGMRNADGNPLTLRDVAYHVLSQTPEQLRVTQQGNAQEAAARQIGALHQEVQGLRNELQQMHNVQQFSYSRSAVDQFAASHPRFDELGPVVERELTLGFDLETAYRRAELLHPSAHAEQTRTTPAQTRPTDRSIHGSPGASASNGANRRPKAPSPTPRDAVQNAMNRVNGRY